MVARRPDEPHRTSTPLELFFDLCFVVAVAQASDRLHHALASQHFKHPIIQFLLVFFAIWWAWMNYTWFASAFDVDDAPYRILTMVQMGGVLVFAAGIGPAFESADYRTGVVGYVIMRVALVLQWLRVARTVPDYRATALRFAVGITAVQSLWIVRLLLPAPISIGAFLVIGLLDLGLPLWAERANMTPWHPHHIAERYGLFTIIVLGESVLATTTAVLMSKSEVGVSVDLIVVAVSALVLLFALWWLYFLEPAGPLLEAHRGRGFLWGYGHFLVFASLAAVGAGIAVITEAITHEIAAGPLLVGYSLALPVTVFLIVLWVLHRGIGGATRVRIWLIVVEVLAFLAVPWLGLVVPIAWVIAALALAASALIVLKTTLPGWRVAG